MTDTEIDPLDAYMATLCVPSSENNKANASTIKTSKECTEDDNEDNDDEGVKDTNDNTNTSNAQIMDNLPDMNKNFSVEEIMALAQRKGNSTRKDLQPTDHSAHNYPPFRKSFYIASPEVQRMTEAEVRAYRQALDSIKIRGRDCPRPIIRWTHCGLVTPILAILEERKFTKPTPIQAQAIPALMSGRDLIGIAKTGSGKTLAFLLPAFRHIMDQRKLSINDGPIALFLSPTRELATQTYMECKRFSKVIGLRVSCAYGGTPIKHQIADCKRGAEMLVCTPGRLLDLLTANNGRVTNLRRVTYLVLDEADRMFDMGFGPQVLKILGACRPDRQLALFSATFPMSMEALARKILSRPLEIVCGAKSRVSACIEQIVEIVPATGKFLKLLDVLGRWCSSEVTSSPHPKQKQGRKTYKENNAKVLIFVERQEAADNLLKDLLRRGHHCTSLHGGKDQSDRICALSDFKSGMVNVMIATSVAARGIDVPDLSLVFNYDCPNHMEDYVHRVGRTGRAGRSGTAITLITPEEAKYAPEILKALQASQATVPTPLLNLIEHWRRSVDGGGTAGKSKNNAVGSGFGGKGLERLTENDSRKKKALKMLVGTDSDGESDEDEGDGDENMHGADKNSSGNGNATKAGSKKQGVAGLASLLPSTSASKSINASSGGNKNTTIDTGDAWATPAAMAIIKQYAGTDAYQSPLYLLNNRHRLNSHESGTIRTVWDRTTSPPTARSHYSELEINDYPQLARFRICHKDCLSAITTASHASIQVRGEHFGGNRVMRDGQRKLYLRIDCVEKEGVECALREIRRELVRVLCEGSADTSRYK